MVFVCKLPDRFERTGHSKDLGVEGNVKIILIYKKWDVVMWTGFIWLRMTMMMMMMMMMIIIIIINLTANFLSPGGSGYNACT